MVDVPGNFITQLLGISNAPPAGYGTGGGGGGVFADILTQGLQMFDANFKNREAARLARAQAAQENLKTDMLRRQDIANTNFADVFSQIMAGTTGYDTPEMRANATENFINSGRAATDLGQIGATGYALNLADDDPVVQDEAKDMAAILGFVTGRGTIGPTDSLTVSDAARTRFDVDSQAAMLQGMVNEGDLAQQRLANQGSESVARIGADARVTAAELAAEARIEAANKRAQQAEEGQRTAAEMGVRSQSMRSIVASQLGLGPDVQPDPDLEAAIMMRAGELARTTGMIAPEAIAQAVQELTESQNPDTWNPVDPSTWFDKPQARRRLNEEGRRTLRRTAPAPREPRVQGETPEAAPRQGATAGPASITVPERLPVGTTVPFQGQTYVVTEPGVAVPQ